MPDAPSQPASAPSLKGRLRADLEAAIRAQDELTRSTLRMALTAVTTAEVAGTTARELRDDEVLAVLRAEAKKRRESADVFAGAGRPDGAARAERERAEEAVLARYLPAQLDDAALAAFVAEEVAAASATGRTGPSAMGAVMSAVRPRVGQLAEGGRVAAEVRRQLQG